MEGVHGTASFVDFYLFSRYCGSSLNDVISYEVKAGIVPQSMFDLFQKQMNGMGNEIQWCQFNYEVVLLVAGRWVFKGHLDLMRARTKPTLHDRREVGGRRWGDERES